MFIFDYIFGIFIGLYTKLNTTLFGPNTAERSLFFYIKTKQNEWFPRWLKWKILNTSGRRLYWMCPKFYVGIHGRLKRTYERFRK